MRKRLFLFLLLCGASLALFAGEGERNAPAEGEPAARSAPPPPALENKTVERVYIVPIREQIGAPILYIVRRGLKEAIEQKADVVVLDMKTPGGRGDITFEIIEALDRFPGETITYVNDEATSAGAFIAAATDEIWFSPRGTIGAAAPVSGSGQEIDPVMREKIVSYLKGKIRALSEGKGHRGAVISAMIDSKYELKIGDTVLKARDDGLLTLTASEAAKLYGDPPTPLLAAGIADDLPRLLKQKFGERALVVKHLEVTWSEQLAVWLNAIAPLLLGAGLLALYIEFKTPGFGVFGVVGIVCLALVFLSSFVAGLSGHEPMLMFAIGVLLIAIEIFLLPGTVVFALTGVMLMLASLLWAMADIWPNEPIEISGDMFVRPLRDLGLGLVLAVVFALLFARFIPKGWFFSRLAVTSPVAGAAQHSGVAPEIGGSADGLVGRSAVAATGLYPSGQIELGGRRYEARLEVGSAPAGTRVIVRRKTDFGLIVEREETGAT